MTCESNSNLVPEGHMGKDCPQGGGRACRNCGQEGHIAKECDQPQNMDNVTCRNCEKNGHFSRDCPEPKDCEYCVLPATPAILTSRREQSAVFQLSKVRTHQSPLQGAPRCRG